MIINHLKRITSNGKFLILKRQNKNGLNKSKQKHPKKKKLKNQQV